MDRSQENCYYTGLDLIRLFRQQVGVYICEGHYLELARTWTQIEAILRLGLRLVVSSSVDSRSQATCYITHVENHSTYRRTQRTPYLLPVLVSVHTFITCTKNCNRRRWQCHSPTYVPTQYNQTQYTNQCHPIRWVGDIMEKICDNCYSGKTEELIELNALIWANQNRYARTNCTHLSNNYRQQDNCKMSS